MTEPQIIPFPTSPYCQVRARVASIWADGSDDGTHPDWRPAVGEKASLIPSIGSLLLAYDVGGTDPIIVTVERVECVVGSDGFLTKSDGRPVYIAPTDDPLLSATGWTWTAIIKGKQVVFSAPTGGVVDLALFVAAPATDNTQTWVQRIPELIDAAGNLVSIESVTSDGGDMVVTLTNGSVTRLPMPESVPGPEGPHGQKGDPGAKGDKGDPGPAGADLTHATAQVINARTGTAYTLVAGDAGKVVTLTNAAAITLTVPGSVFTTGQRVDALVLGAGMVTVVGSSCTVNGTPSLVSRARYSAFTVLFTSATTAVVVGDLA